MSEERSAKLMLVMVVIVWGLNVVMVKYLSGFFSPLMLAAFRIGAAGALLALVVTKSHGWVKLSGREWWAIIGAGLSSIYFHQLTLNAGVQTTSASTASLILGLNPLVTSLLAYAIFREPLTLRKMGGILGGFVGVTLVVFGDSWQKTAGLHFAKGELLVVVAMLAYVIGGLFIKQATRTVHVLVVTSYSHIIAAVLLAVTAIGQVTVSGQVPHLPTNWFIWAVLLFSGWVATGLSAVWWNSGIRVIGAGRTTMFLNGMPIASLIFAVLLLGEKITWVHIVGFLTVFLAIYWGTSQKKQVPTSTPVSTQG